MQSKYDENYYFDKAQETTGFAFNYYNILKDEEIANNPLYNPPINSTNQSEEPKAPNRSQNDNTTFYEQVAPKSICGASYADAQNYVPRCPVCQSPNIEKLSDINRAVHGLAFGLFSKTARSQWVCKNCGNKW